jgi:hypothetical protein
MRPLCILSFALATFTATHAYARNPEADAMAAWNASQSSTGAAKDDAQYRLGIALYEMGMKQAAYGIFSEIADRPSSTKFGETLAWLVKLSIDLPEPADIAERVGKYDEAHIAMFDNAAQRDTHARIEWMSAQYAYRNRRYDEAIARYARVDRESPFYGKAQFMGGMANVMARRSVPAVQSFEHVIAWLDESKMDASEAGHLRDLANISMARTYFSAATRVDENGVPVVDPTRISAAAKYYRRVSPAGELFFDAIFEDAWTRYMAGDFVHALGDVRMLASPEVGPRFSEAALLEALVLYQTCRYDDAQAAIERMRHTYEPRKQAVESKLDALAKASDAEQFRLVASSVAPAEHKLAGYIAYDTLLESEKKLFSQLPAAFKSSQLGGDVQDALALASDIVRRQATDLGRERLLREKAELDEHLRDAKKIEIDIVAARRNALESSSPPPPLPPPARPRNATTSWPVNGTAAPDALYHAPITVQCR